MGTRSKPPLSRREREIMEVVYRLGSPSAAEIAANLEDPPSYSAVRATIAVLEGKGHLRHQDRQGRYEYLPTVSAATARRKALRELVTNFFGGSSTRAVVALLDESAEGMKAEDLEEIRRLIERGKQTRR
jgi:predicted transcriptional regulator